MVQVAGGTEGWCVCEAMAVPVPLLAVTCGASLVLGVLDWSHSVATTWRDCTGALGGCVGELLASLLEALDLNWCSRCSSDRDTAAPTQRDGAGTSVSPVGRLLAEGW